ncbi:MAG TPA: hypothetical protein RMH99_08390 [Sandaracinaceae bacterium LLY-WYZ-13_1]|nr:hypothetical protein [Sandaracinaceae bacterium LLY-WYZ-13_1]
MHRHGLVLVVAFLVLAGGCTWLMGPTVPVDGYRLDEASWARDQVALRRRASFDLQCDPSRLRFRVLDAFDDRYARQVGVQGCGQRAVYVDEHGNYMWVRNH